MQIKRGDMFYADLSPVVGSEQGGVRPVLIIQNDLGNTVKVPRWEIAYKFPPEEQEQ